jgi:hypothetical protein
MRFCSAQPMSPRRDAAAGTLAGSGQRSRIGAARPGFGSSDGHLAGEGSGLDALFPSGAQRRSAALRFVFAVHQVGEVALLKSLTIVTCTSRDGACRSA